jgi:ATP-dependent Lon protease
MIREVLRPNDKFINIQIPNEYVDKNIEVLIFDIDEPIKQEQRNNNLAEKLKQISKNISKVDKDIDILSLDKDINSDIF